VFGLQNRTEAVTEQTLSQLGTDGIVPPGEFDILVSIQAVRERCGRSHDVDSLIERGECQCREG